MKKALFITYYWVPCGGPGVQRTLKFVKYLPSFGIEPLVITVNERKASYQVKDYSLSVDVDEKLKLYRTNTFEPFNIYKTISNKSEIPYSGFANESSPNLIQKISRFIRGNFFIPDARLGWNIFAYLKACKVIKRENPSAIIISTPPHSTQLIGLKLKKRFNIPLIADLRDPWTDIFYYDKFYHTKAAKCIDAKMERRVLENADHILVVSHHIKELFISKSDKIDPNKIVVIPNGYDEEDFKINHQQQQSPFTIAYTGTISDDYDIDAFITAIQEIRRDGYTDIKLKFMGRVSPMQAEKFDISGLDEITEFIPHSQHEQSIKLLQESSALLLVIPKIKNNEGILTGKLFEYIGSNRPIIAIGPKNGDAAAIIRDCNAGEMFDYNDAFDIKEMILKIMANHLRTYQTDNYKKFSRKALTGELAKLIK